MVSLLPGLLLLLMVATTNATGDPLSELLDWCEKQPITCDMPQCRFILITPHSLPLLLMLQLKQERKTWLSLYNKAGNKCGNVGLWLDKDYSNTIKVFGKGGVCNNSKILTSAFLNNTLSGGNCWHFKVVLTGNQVKVYSQGHKNTNLSLTCQHDLPSHVTVEAPSWCNYSTHSTPTTANTLTISTNQATTITQVPHTTTITTQFLPTTTITTQFLPTTTITTQFLPTTTITTQFLPTPTTTTTTQFLPTPTTTTTTDSNITVTTQEDHLSLPWYVFFIIGSIVLILVVALLVWQVKTSCAQNVARLFIPQEIPHSLRSGCCSSTLPTRPFTHHNSDNSLYGAPDPLTHHDSDNSLYGAPDPLTHHDSDNSLYGAPDPLTHHDSDNSLYGAPDPLTHYDSDNSLYGAPEPITHHDSDNSLYAAPDHNM